MQYVENVANYLAGTPWKGMGKKQTFQTKIAIPKGETLTPKEQKQILQNILDFIALLGIKENGLFIVAADVELHKKPEDSVNVNILIEKEQRNLKTAHCPNWSYIFPYGSGNYTINTGINYFWVGPDSKPCFPDNCSNSCYKADETFEYAVNTKYQSNNSSGQYYVNIESFTFNYNEHMCTLLRDTVQNWIYRADMEIASLLQNYPHLTQKEFIGANMFHYAIFKYWSSCGDSRGKRVRVTYSYGNTTNIPPLE